MAMERPEEFNRIVLDFLADPCLGYYTRGGSSNDFLERLQGKEDYPASLEEHLDWLRRAGLSATCLHLHLHRALIAGKK